MPHLVHHSAFRESIKGKTAKGIEVKYTEVGPWFVTLATFQQVRTFGPRPELCVGDEPLVGRIPGSYSKWRQFSAKLAEFSETKHG